MALAYFAIPIALRAFVKHAGIPRWRQPLGLFGAFIFACGCGHLLEAVSIWWPAYPLVGSWHALTAALSLGVAYYVVRKRRALSNDELVRRVSDLARAARGSLGVESDGGTNRDG